MYSYTSYSSILAVLWPYLLHGVLERNIAIVGLAAVTNASTRPPDALHARGRSVVREECVYRYRLQGGVWPRRALHKRMQACAKASSFLPFRAWKLNRDLKFIDWSAREP